MLPYFHFIKYDIPQDDFKTLENAVKYEYYDMKLIPLENKRISYEKKLERELCDKDFYNYSDKLDEVEKNIDEIKRAMDGLADSHRKVINELTSEDYYDPTIHYKSVRNLLRLAASDSNNQKYIVLDRDEIYEKIIELFSSHFYSEKCRNSGYIYYFPNGKKAIRNRKNLTKRL